MQKLTSSRCTALTGNFSPPGDKSISHRSVILGGLAEGETTVRGLLEGEDVLNTVAALRAMGAKIRKDDLGVWHIEGTGAKGLQKPEQVLDMGNSGTSTRLLMGLVAGTGFSAHFTGDASLRKRPMSRVIEPLSLMGARIESEGGKLPLTVFGTSAPISITYELPVPSAQVKSAILLAGLGAKGVTKVIETAPTRDHSENMLRGFGAKVFIEKRADGADIISIEGKPVLKAQNINVPGDPSSAAFPLVAALLCPGSSVILRHIGLNPRRTGLFAVLREMGGQIKEINQSIEGGEAVADLVVSSSALHGIDVPPERAPSMIDEYPILAVAASCASGITRMKGLAELRVKESDRLELMAKGLSRCGAKADIEGDDLIVYGTGHPPRGGTVIETAMDHRIAMSFLVLGMRTEDPISVDDGGFIATSFPKFVPAMNALGAAIV